MRTTIKVNAFLILPIFVPKSEVPSLNRNRVERKLYESAKMVYVCVDRIKVLNISHTTNDVL